MKEIKGCGTALVTPFNEDGSIDYEAYAALVERQWQEGVDFLVPVATTAETPALSSEEKQKLLALTREHCGDLPLLVGCGSNSLPGTKANMELLNCEAVDAWLVVVPFYNKPTQEGQYQYFKAVAALTEKPVFLYNVPGRTGVNMAPQTVARLAADVKNIAGIKEASGNIGQVKAILESVPEDFIVLSGDDDMTLDMMKLGAKGCISVASNIAPREVSALTLAAARGDYDWAEDMDNRLKSLYRNCFIESNPIPVKAGLEYLELMKSCVRLPLSEATDATKQLMKETIDELFGKEK